MFAPPFGSSNGYQFATSVTVSGASGLTNAYVSVLSARGSPAISGASRWLDASAALGANAATAASIAPAPVSATTRCRRDRLEVVTEDPLCCQRHGRRCRRGATAFNRQTARAVAHAAFARHGQGGSRIQRRWPERAITKPRC